MYMYISKRYRLWVFSKLTATVDISYIRESVEMKQKPVITYIGVFQYA